MPALTRQPPTPRDDVCVRRQPGLTIVIVVASVLLAVGLVGLVSGFAIDNGVMVLIAGAVTAVGGLTLFGALRPSSRAR
jgi:hypothetical protein